MSRVCFPTQQVQCHFIHSPASMTAALNSPSFHRGRETLLQQRVASTKICGETPISLVKPHVSTYLWRNASCCGPQLIDINKDGCIIICSHCVTPLQPGIWMLVTHWQNKLDNLLTGTAHLLCVTFPKNDYVKLKRFNLNLNLISCVQTGAHHQMAQTSVFSPQSSIYIFSQWVKEQFNILH